MRGIAWLGLAAMTLVGCRSELLKQGRALQEQACQCTDAQCAATQLEALTRYEAALPATGPGDRTEVLEAVEAAQRCLCRRVAAHEEHLIGAGDSSGPRANDQARCRARTPRYLACLLRQTRLADAVNCTPMAVVLTRQKAACACTNTQCADAELAEISRLEDRLDAVERSSRVDELLGEARSCVCRHVSCQSDDQR